jgi:hypothetical protein
MRETEQTPHNKRRGLLRNANPPGDFSKAARCRAKTRRGTPCQCPAMPNGRCRLHGGLSTGPKTAEGIERIRRAVTKHGRYSRAARDEKRYFRTLLGECRAALAGIDEVRFPIPLTRQRRDLESMADAKGQGLTVCT